MADITLRKRRDDDIEALASVPIPQYADAMERENARSKKKYGDCFNIRHDEVIDDDDVMGLLPGKKFDGDRNGIALAERTSQILSCTQSLTLSEMGIQETSVATPTTPRAYVLGPMGHTAS